MRGWNLCREMPAQVDCEGLRNRQKVWLCQTFLPYRIRAPKGLSGSAVWPMARKICARSIVRSIPLSLLKQKSCSALASTVLESPLYRAKSLAQYFFVRLKSATVTASDGQFFLQSWQPMHPAVHAFIVTGPLSLELHATAYLAS